MIPNWTQRIRHEKYPTGTVHETVSPKFSSIRSTMNCFQDTISPLTPMLKFQSATIFMEDGQKVE